jgi:hypothetical protein
MEDGEPQPQPAGGGVPPPARTALSSCPLSGPRTPFCGFVWAEGSLRPEHGGSDRPLLSCPLLPVPGRCPPGSTRSS